MEIISSPLPALSIDVGDASLQRDPQARLAQGAPAPSATVPQASAVVPVAPADTIAQTLLTRLSAAVARQEGLTQLISDLSQALALTKIPASVRTDMARVMVQAQPLIRASTTALVAAQPPGEVSNATAPTAQTTAAPATIPAQALPAISEAIERLQASLKAWQPEAAPGSPAPARLSGTQPPATPPSVAPQPAPPVSTTVQPASSLLPSPATATQPMQAPPQAVLNTPADGTLEGRPAPAPVPSPAPTPEAAQLVATLGSAAMRPVAGMQTPRAAQGAGLADALVSLLVAQQPAATAQEAARRQRNASQPPPPANDADAHSFLASAALMAYSKATPTRTQGKPAPWPADPSPALIARTLMQRTEAALAQTRALEVASQVIRAEAAASSPHPAAPTQWTFDLPLATPFGHTLVRFEIDRQAQGKRKETPDVIWRARLSLDIEPLGPVHAQIALRGAKAWVSLWAERPETAQLLETQQPLLRQSLGTDALEADILLQTGAPAGEPATGGAIRDASA